MLIILILPLFLILIFLTISNRKRPKNFPPGPPSLPIIGGLYRLGRDPFTSSLALQRDYGPIVGIDFASFRSIIINDHKLGKMALSDPAIQGRPDLTTWKSSKSRTKDGIRTGIIGADWTVAHENSRFALKSLRQFGFGTKRMEMAILEEVDQICTVFDTSPQNRMKDGGGGINVYHFLNLYSGKIMWALLSARKMPSEQDLVANIVADAAITHAGFLSGPFNFFPCLLTLAPKWTGWTHFEECYGTFRQFFVDCVKAHKRDRSTSTAFQNEKDFVDLWLDEMDQTKDPQSIFYGDIGEFNLATVLGDMILGGVDTVAQTLSWAFAILINFPEIQKKVQAHLDRLAEELGLSNGKIYLDHRPRLPYVNAFMNEVMRFRPPVPWALPHKAMEDTTISNYYVPKGTTVYINLFAISQDPKVWPDPQEFRPERFLSPDGQQLLNIEEFTPFSMGRRICPGRSLAMEELFLILANILKNYDILSPDQCKPSLKHVPLFVITPVPFKFFARRRTNRANHHD